MRSGILLFGLLFFTVIVGINVPEEVMFGKFPGWAVITGLGVAFVAILTSFSYR